MTHRPLIVGESNPHPGSEAINAVRVGSTGWRIWQMIRSVHRDATVDDYHDAFDRRNLCDRQWTYTRAAKEAQLIMRSAPPRTAIVLLGHKVRRSFGVPEDTWPFISVRGVNYYAIPHPSGLNRWYNDADNKLAVATLLAILFKQSMKEQYSD